jgi:hypothetical protein
LQEDDPFSAEEYVASDGGVNGDGRFRCSYKNPSNDPLKERFNLAWHEVQTGVENSYQRVGLWFPVLGNNKWKPLYSEIVLFLAMHAATSLHNWILNTESLS